MSGAAVAARRATAVQALQRLLVVTAAATLLGHGGVQLAPRLLATGAGAGAPAAAGGAMATPARPVAAPAIPARPVAEGPTPARPVAEGPTPARPLAGSRPVERAVALRVARVLAVPAGSTETGAGPGSSPLVAPHLPAGPGAGPPTSPAVRSVVRDASGRAPPVAAGT